MEGGDEGYREETFRIHLASEVKVTLQIVLAEVVLNLLFDTLLDAQLVHSDEWGPIVVERTEVRHHERSLFLSDRLPNAAELLRKVSAVGEWCSA